jgi:alanine racemase
LALVGVGYADGYHRRAGSSDTRAGARAYVRARFAPLIGRISMDLLAIDVTDVPGVARGDPVELIGGHIPVDEVAGHAQTVGYEILTSLGRRYERVYVRGP